MSNIKGTFGSSRHEFDRLGDNAGADFRALHIHHHRDVPLHLD
jgi:hypothetical protein